MNAFLSLNRFASVSILVVRMISARLAGARAICACLICACLIGCGESKTSLHELDHTTPAHWPVDLKDAAEKMRTRLLSLQEQKPDPAKSVGVELKELSDLIGWIPEVAADTDLTEQQWMKLFEASEVARKQAQNAKQVSPEFAQQIETLCSLLMEAQELLAKSDEPTDSLTDSLAE